MRCEQDETIAKLSQLRKCLFLSNDLLAVAVIVGLKGVYIFLMFREQALKQLAGSEVLASTVS